MSSVRPRVHYFLAIPIAGLSLRNPPVHPVFRQAAQAKSVLGVNGALDFGPLAGDQPGGEGTGKVRGESCAGINPTVAVCIEERAVRTM